MPYPFTDSDQLTPLEDLLNDVVESSFARVQAGSFTVNITTMGSPASVPVTFPVAFSGTPRVTVTLVGVGTNLDTRFVSVVTRSPTGFTAAGKNNDSTANITFDWIAVLP